PPRGCHTDHRWAFPHLCAPATADYPYRRAPEGGGGNTRERSPLTESYGSLAERFRALEEARTRQVLSGMRLDVEQGLPGRVPQSADELRWIHLSCLAEWLPADCVQRCLSPARF